MPTVFMMVRVEVKKSQSTSLFSPIGLFLVRDRIALFQEDLEQPAR